MAVKTESIQQSTTAAWVASSTVTLLLDRIGLVTRYDVTHQLTPSATLFGANQIDALWRPFRNLQFIAGGYQYFALPDEAEGHGATLLHHLNKLDGYGAGYVHQLVAAPSQAFYTPRLVFHAGVRPRRKDGVDNLYDMTGFVPAGIESSPQITWLTTANTVMDDTVTISSGTLIVTAHRVLGTTGDILQEMEEQGVGELMRALRSGMGGQMLPDSEAVGMVPAWYGQSEAPASTFSNYGSELDMQLGGFNKRISMLVQDATATRPIRADDQVTEVRIHIPEKGVTILQMDSEQLAAGLMPGDFLVADEAVGLGGNPAPGGIYPIDMRPRAQTLFEKTYGLDTRGRQSGYAKIGRTINTNASGDNILTLTERSITYKGRLSNA